MWACSKCGLINPDSSTLCDCGKETAVQVYRERPSVILRSAALSVALMIGFGGAYFVTLRWYQQEFDTSVSSPLFPWIAYLWWLPFGIPLFLLVRRRLPRSVGIRSLVFALLFAPGLMGIYRIVWLVPAFYAAVGAFQQPSSAMFRWVALFTGIPVLAFWALSYLAIHIARLAQERERRGRGSRTTA
jgi:hypothetical protein